jgi:protein-tyrosine phosphatase
MEAIDYENMLKNMRSRASLESKPIKKMMFYNYLNDNIPSLIIDCRKDFELNKEKEGGVLINSFHLCNFSAFGVMIKSGFRLILILEDDQDLKTSEELEKIRFFIKEEDKIEKGIYYIKNSNYQEFLQNYKSFIINDNSDSLAINLAKTKFPYLILDDLIYIGNFFNSKNLHQMNCLKIKSVFSLLKEEDIELKKMLPNYHFIPIDEENHAEIDFLEIIDLIDTEILTGKNPILIYCFSGQSVSMAVCIAYLMKSKKWSLEFATAYMMKICSDLKIPTWLYTQLQRLDLRKSDKTKINGI